MARKKAKALPPKMITVYAEILQETEDAILVRCDDEADGVWLPKSQIEYAGERGDIGVEVQLPDWLGDEKGFFDGMGYAPAQAPAVPAEPEQPETVTLKGAVQNWREVEEGTASEIRFVIDGTDEEGRDTEKEYLIPVEYVLSKELNESAETDDFITVTHAYALELGLVQTAEEPAAPDTQPGKRAFGDNVKWIKEETITYTQPLDEAEKARYADEMAALDEEIEELEDERSEVSSRLKKQIDAKEEERRALARSVRSGKEEREAFCDCLKDYNTGEMVWTEAAPPHREVMRRKMTKEEMQPTLLEYPDKQGAAPAGQDFDALADAPAAEAGEEGEVELLRSCENCIHYDAENLSCEGPWDDDCSTDSLNPAFMSGWEPVPYEPATEAQEAM